MKTRIVCTTLTILLLCPPAAAQKAVNAGRDEVSALRSVMPADSSVSPGLVADSVDDKADFFVPSLGYCLDTYVPAIGFNKQFGPYAAEPFLPITILTRDPYNENKWEVSWSVLVTLGVSFVTYPFPPGSVVRYILFWPILFLNSLHNLVVVGPNGLAASDRFWFAAIVGCRTDCYSRHVTWARWTPQAGVQLGFPVAGESEAGSLKWIVLSGGIEAPIDFVGGPQSLAARYFIGLKYYIHQN